MYYGSRKQQYFENQDKILTKTRLAFYKTLVELFDIFINCFIHLSFATFILVIFYIHLILLFFQPNPDFFSAFVNKFISKNSWPCFCLYCCWILGFDYGVAMISYSSGNQWISVSLSDIVWDILQCGLKVDYWRGYYYIMKYFIPQ